MCELLLIVATTTSNTLFPSVRYGFLRCCQQLSIIISLSNKPIKLFQFAVSADVFSSTVAVVVVDIVVAAAVVVSWVCNKSLSTLCNNILPTKSSKDLFLSLSAAKKSGPNTINAPAKAINFVLKHT